jgi:hypothetical protein
MAIANATTPATVTADRLKISALQWRAARLDSQMAKGKHEERITGFRRIIIDPADKERAEEYIRRLEAADATADSVWDDLPYGPRPRD